MTGARNGLEAKCRVTRQKTDRRCLGSEPRILGGRPVSGEEAGGESSLWEAKDDAEVVLADVISSTVLLKGKLRKGGHGN